MCVKTMNVRSHVGMAEMESISTLLRPTKEIYKSLDELNLHYMNNLFLYTRKITTAMVLEMQPHYQLFQNVIDQLTKNAFDTQGPSLEWLN